MKFYNYSLHRQLLEKAIKQCSPLVEGKVLDAGSKNRRYDSFFKKAGEIIAIDIKPEPGKNVITADITDLPFKENHFDAVISFEVLEYVIETGKALEEIARVLKNKGVFIFSVPFLDPVHGDIDNVRFTMKGWEQLLNRRFRINEGVIIGGRYSLIWNLYFERVRNHYNKLFRIILLPALVFLKSLAVCLDKNEKTTRFPMGYLFVCTKKE